MSIVPRRLTSTIRVWREIWRDDLPFLFVHLPGHRYASDPDYKHWCLIREAQMRVYRKLRNTGLAVLTDCGELDNIHPKDKAPVGYRLYLQALSEVYHLMPREQAAARPPAFSGRSGGAGQAAAPPRADPSRGYAPHRARPSAQAQSRLIRAAG